LALSLGIVTTAEGVETKEQLDRVRAEGRTEAQGYYSSRPKPPAELPHMFPAHRDGVDSAA
jgi:EAL domain-containing protein (putative c-di-GMP-specific phosphodiesterase class I)